MALIANLETNFGEPRDLYVRINNVEASNHGMPAQALARGFVSREAFQAGKRFVWERQFEFLPDVSLPMWEQAYVALKSEPEFAASVDA